MAPRADLPMKNLLKNLIRLYQRVAPTGMRNACRFTPSCSEYALQVIDKHGSLHGSICAARRILRCRPPYGGVDLP